MLSQKDFAIYVLDDNSVHLMPEIRSALFKKGYVFVIIGGGIYGDVQLNDTHYHCPLKVGYREKEKKLILRQISEDPSKTPSPSRDKIMPMLIKPLERRKRSFGPLFLRKGCTEMLKELNFLILKAKS